LPGERAGGSRWAGRCSRAAIRRTTRCGWFRCGSASRTGSPTSPSVSSDGADARKRWGQPTELIASRIKVRDIVRTGLRVDAETAHLALRTAPARSTSGRSHLVSVADTNSTLPQLEAASTSSRSRRLSDARRNAAAARGSACRLECGTEHSALNVDRRRHRQTLVLPTGSLGLPCGPVLCLRLVPRVGI
jgi:hypothetical protein